EYFEKQRKLNDIMNSVHHYQNTITRQDPAKGRLLKKKMHALKSMERRFEKEGYTHLDTLEEAIDVYFEPFDWNSQKIICDLHYDQISVENKILIQDVNLFVKGHDKVVLIGNNGCGKTTLLQQVYQDLKMRDDLNIGYMPQNYALYMKDFVSPLSFLAPSKRNEDITRAREMMARMKFTREEMVQNILDCSEGQKAKLFILKFILDKCNVLILDEPTRNLSPLSNPVLREILLDFDGAIISVSHDRKYIEEVCDYVYLIKDNHMSLIENEGVMNG
ncbi:MAG: ATP-binding cassette domain-containing protein, partial [Traorella sp.]